jgi:hypothetical protein
MRTTSMTTTHTTMFWIDSAGIAHINWANAGRIHEMRTDESLRFTIADCREAIEAHPEGPKAGYYQDTILICHRILSQRHPREYFNKPGRYASVR